MKGMFAVIDDSIENMANEIVQNQIAAERKKTQRPNQNNWLEEKPKQTKAKVQESEAKQSEDLEETKSEREDSVESEKEPVNIWADPDIFNRPQKTQKQAVKPQK